MNLILFSHAENRMFIKMIEMQIVMIIVIVTPIL